jgi:hypothetical protein
MKTKINQFATYNLFALVCAVTWQE